MEGASQSGQGRSLRGRPAARVMLMRHAAVTLLLAALTISVVRAQALQQESQPPSSQLKGQEQEVPVKPQPDSPLRLSVKASWPTDLGFLQLKASVENVSNRDIGMYSIRRAAAGDERPGHESWSGRLPGFSWPGKALRPGQVDVKKNPWAPLPSRLFPQDSFEVHSVVFMDGTIWCADECHSAESWAGHLAGGRAATDRLLKVLAAGGLDAVIKVLREKVAEDDPVPAVVVSTGELVDVVPPSGHTPEWERGFRSATKSVADTLWEQYVLHGTGQIERRLRDAYQVEGAK